jgi:hypothetical protein
MVLKFEQFFFGSHVTNLLSVRVEVGSAVVRGVGKSPRFTSKTGFTTLKNWKNIYRALLVLSELPLAVRVTHLYTPCFSNMPILTAEKNPLRKPVVK